MNCLFHAVAQLVGRKSDSAGRLKHTYSSSARIRQAAGPAAMFDDILRHAATEGLTVDAFASAPSP